MKVLALAADKDGGVWFYRMAEPARVTSQLGIDITVDDGVDADVTLHQNGFATVNEIMTDADVVIVQRPVKQIWHSFIEQAKRQGIATVVELDDDYDSIHLRNAAYNPPSLKEAQNNAWVRACTEIADHVTVSTPALLKFGKLGRRSVLRNCVPEDYFSIKPKEELPCTVIGWSGSVQTHPLDLQMTKGAIADIFRTNEGCVLGVVGDGTDVKVNLRLPWNCPERVTGWVPREQYMQAMADTFNIGIVPLEISPFNEGKSDLKGLEMASVGIPFVASPTREYQRLAAYGIGKVARSPGDWRRELQRMIDRPEETRKKAKQYQEILYNEGRTYESSAHQWVEAWDQAAAYRKSHHG